MAKRKKNEPKSENPAQNPPAREPVIDDERFRKKFDRERCVRTDHPFLLWIEQWENKPITLPQLEWMVHEVVKGPPGPSNSKLAIDQMHQDPIHAYWRLMDFYNSIPEKKEIEHEAWTRGHGEHLTENGIEALRLECATKNGRQLKKDEVNELPLARVLEILREESSISGKIAAPEPIHPRDKMCEFFYSKYPDRSIKLETLCKMASEQWSDAPTKVQHMQGMLKTWCERNGREMPRRNRTRNTRK